MKILLDENFAPGILAALPRAKPGEVLEIV
jgi:hypothetical protein